MRVRAACTTQGTLAAGRAGLVQGMPGSWLLTSGAQAELGVWGKREPMQYMDFDVRMSIVSDVQVKSEWLLRESTCCCRLDSCARRCQVCSQCCGRQQSQIESAKVGSTIFLEFWVRSVEVWSGRITSDFAYV
jgi:hypothetical protein